MEKIHIELFWNSRDTVTRDPAFQSWHLNTRTTLKDTVGKRVGACRIAREMEAKKDLI